jgi:hypothetical protein
MSKPRIKVGDEVIVPDPIDGDIHHHEFVGHVTDIRDGIAVVEDQDSDFFELELDRLKPVED